MGLVVEADGRGDLGKLELRLAHHRGGALKPPLTHVLADRPAIAGLDPERPLLPQFDKLTDDQMRKAVRTMDPWAPK